MEQTALNLCWDAVKVMKAAMARTATTKFLDVFEAAFGEEENAEEVPELHPTEKEENKILPAAAMTTQVEADIEFTDEPGTSSSTAGVKWTTRSASKQPPIKKSRKQEKPTKVSGPFVLQNANALHPTKADRNTYLHTGVPDEFISDRESGPYSRVAIYKCNYARVMRKCSYNPA